MVDTVLGNLVGLVEVLIVVFIYDKSSSFFAEENCIVILALCISRFKMFCAPLLYKYGVKKMTKGVPTMMEVHLKAKDRYLFL